MRDICYRSRGHERDYADMSIDDIPIEETAEFRIHSRTESQQNRDAFQIVFPLLGDSPLSALKRFRVKLGNLVVGVEIVRKISFGSEAYTIRIVCNQHGGEYENASCNMQVPLDGGYEYNTASLLIKGPRGYYFSPSDLRTISTD